MSNKSHSRTGTIVSSIVSILLLALTGWVILNRQYVFDQWNFWQYQPSTQIAAIADRSGMSSKGEFYFYASQPAVDTAGQFNLNCQKKEASSAILGCYNGGRIYIYDVTNSQLDGIEEVSAAHETLHAIWDRMSDSDKQSVSSLLEAEYVKLNDPALKTRMDYYSRTEPGERDNELHSILGTEYSNLGPQLEAHYARYFTDRSKVVALHSGYQKVFDGIQAQTDALKLSLDGLASDLTTSIASYNDSAAALTTESDALKNSTGSIDRTSASQVNAYNASRQSLLNRITQLDALRATINAKTDDYNTKLAEYNKLIVRSDQLQQSIDSSLAPAPSL